MLPPASWIPAAAHEVDGREEFLKFNVDLGTEFFTVEAISALYVGCSISVGKNGDEISF